MLYKQVDVELPKTPGPGPFPPKKRLIKVAILENGTIQVDGCPCRASSREQPWPDVSDQIVLWQWKGTGPLYGEVRGIMES